MKRRGSVGNGRLILRCAALDDRIARKTNGELSAAAGASATVTVPCIAVMIFWTMERPRPAPSAELSPRQKRSKTSVEALPNARSGMDDVDRRKRSNPHEDGCFARRVLDRILDQILQNRLECEAAGANE